MAASDTYVNSEGLNVNKTHEMERKDKKKNIQTIPDTRIERTKPTNTPISMGDPSISASSEFIITEQNYLQSSQSSSSSLHTQNATAPTNHEETKSNLSSISTPQSYLLDSVAQVLNNSGNVTKKKIPHRTLTPVNSTVHENNSPNVESEEIDPIMIMMNEKEKAHILDSVADDENDNINIPQKTKNDPNRFFMDLDQRMSVVVKNPPQVENSSEEEEVGVKDQVFHLSKKIMPFQSISKLSHSVASWVGISHKDSPHLQDPYTSVSTSSERESLTHSKLNHDEEIGVNVSSSAFLGDAEAAELLRIQHRNSDMIFIMKRFLEERNKKHFLYLGIFVFLYLWTRAR
jgi:hypothetical protein